MDRPAEGLFVFGRAHLVININSHIATLYKRLDPTTPFLEEKNFHSKGLMWKCPIDVAIGLFEINLKNNPAHLFPMGLA